MARRQQQEQSDWEIDESLDGVETRDEPAPGRYLVTVSSMEMREAKSGDKKFFNVGFKVKDCEVPELESSIGLQAWDLYNLNKEALWKLKSLVKACGYDAGGSRIPNLKGCELILDIYEDEYNGKVNLRTRKYQNPSEKGWSGINETRMVGDEAAAPPEGKENAPAASKAAALPAKSAPAGEIEI
jgi:hypothetical protein